MLSTKLVELTLGQFFLAYLLFVLLQMFVGMVTGAIVFAVKSLLS